jgi:hypothetical protein
MKKDLITIVILYFPNITLGLTKYWSVLVRSGEQISTVELKYWLVVLKKFWPLCWTIDASFWTPVTVKLLESTTPSTKVCWGIPADLSSAMASSFAAQIKAFVCWSSLDLGDMCGILRRLFRLVFGGVRWWRARLVWSSTEFRGLVVFFVFFMGLCASWVVHLLLFPGDLFCMRLCMWFLPK